MSSQKDASQLNSGSGQAGRRSVGAASVTFKIPNGPTATLWLEELNVDTANIGTMAVDTVTVDTLTATTVNATTTTSDTGSFTTSLSTDSFTADTGSFSTSLTTDLIESVAPTLTLNSDVSISSDLSVTGDISGNKITANDMDEGIRAYTISAADGDQASDIRVRTNLLLEDTVGPTLRDLTAGTVAAENVEATGTITAESEVSLYDPVEDAAYRPLSGMLQRFSEISEAFEATNIGEACVVETYDPARPLGHLEWTTDALGDVEAIATDGRYLYTIGSNGVAQALEGPLASVAVTYTLSNWSGGHTNIHVTTNGKYVAFCYDVYTDIFEVDDGAAPLITFSAPNPGPVEGAWLGSDALYITQRDLGSPKLWKIYLDGVTTEDELLLNGAGPVSGYGNYLVVAQDSGFGPILIDAPSLTTIGTFLDIGAIPRLALDGNYLYLATDKVRIYSLDKVNGIGDAKLLWEPEEGVTDSFFAYDHRYLYILDTSYQIFVYRKDTLQKVAVLDVTNYLSAPDVIKGIEADGQYLYIAITDLSGPSDQDVAKINMAHAPATFVQVDPDVSGERIWNHVMVPVENHLPQLPELVRADVGLFDTLRSPVTPLALGSFQYDLGTQTFSPYDSALDQINIAESGRDSLGTYDFAVPGPPSLGAIVSVNLNTGGTPLIVETEIDYFAFAKVRIRFYDLTGTLVDPADNTIIRIAVFSPGSYSAWATTGI